jgi:hypothetical protein
MNAMHIPSFAVTAMSADSVLEPLVSSSTTAADVSRDAWGSCDIRLVADRVASLRSGSTHKVYRAWRFVVVMSEGRPRPGTIVFTSAVDPARPVKGQTRYALEQLANQGAIGVGDAAAFSWAATSIGTADPIAVALEQTHRELDTAGWRQDASIPTHFSKPDPTEHVSAEPVLVASDAGSSRSVGEGQEAMGIAPPRREMMRLDEWETDGGASSSLRRTPAVQRPAPFSVENEPGMLL